MTMDDLCTAKSRSKDNSLTQSCEDLFITAPSTRNVLSNNNDDASTCCSHQREEGKLSSGADKQDAGSEQQHETSPVAEQPASQKHKSSQSHRQSTIKLEEMLNELNQLDIAVSEGALTRSLAHVRSLLVHEIHRIHSQLPPHLRRRYSSQMPSAMKRIVCVPINKSSFSLQKLGFATGSIPNIESTIGVQVRHNSKNGTTAVEANVHNSPKKADKRTGTATTTTNNSMDLNVGSRIRRPQQTQRLRYQQLCSSIPPLLPAQRRSSYYADYSNANCTSYGSNCSLMTAPICSDPFLGNGSYLYRCDYAQRVRFENGYFTMQDRIYLPENPSFKIIGRILGPRGNSLRQLEAETRCKIVIRGKGSVKDSHKEKRLKGLPGWEHLEESLHVLITAQHRDQYICSRQLHYAVHCIRNLLTPRFDAYKREQLLQLAIINGTYQPRP